MLLSSLSQKSLSGPSSVHILDSLLAMLTGVLSPLTNAQAPSSTPSPSPLYHYPPGEGGFGGLSPPLGDLGGKAGGDFPWMKEKKAGVGAGKKGGDPYAAVPGKSLFSVILFKK